MIHIFNKDFDNQYYNLNELAKITGYKRDWLKLYLCRSEFAPYRSHQQSNGGGLLLLYNSTTVDFMNKLRNRRYAQAYVN